MTINTSEEDEDVVLDRLLHMQLVHQLHNLVKKKVKQLLHMKPVHQLSIVTKNQTTHIRSTIKNSSNAPWS